MQSDPTFNKNMNTAHYQILDTGVVSVAPKQDILSLLSPAVFGRVPDSSTIDFLYAHLGMVLSGPIQDLHPIVAMNLGSDESGNVVAKGESDLRPQKSGLIGIKKGSAPESINSADFAIFERVMTSYPHASRHEIDQILADKWRVGVLTVCRKVTAFMYEAINPDLRLQGIFKRYSPRIFNNASKVNGW
ncbi:MAG: hypothetical protein Q8K75_11510 [Chlamydiales bacterium]|nr:hypothetical protein [Chlamydiales bacterium]